MEIENRVIFPAMFCGVYHGGLLWGSRLFGKDLINIDVATGEVRFDYYLDKLYKSHQLFNAVIYHGGRLIFIPGRSEYIVLYDIDSKFAKYIPYEDNGVENPIKYSCYEFCGNTVFLFPKRVKHILKLNLDTMEIIKIDKPFQNLDVELDDDLMFGEGVRLSDETVLLRMINKNIFFKFDLTTYKYEWIIGSGCNVKVKIGRIYKNNDCDFIIGNGIDGKIYRIDNEGYNVIFDGKEQYSNLILDNDKIWAVPAYKGKIKLIDLVSQTEKIYEYNKEFQYNPVLNKDCVTRMITKNDNIFYIVPSFTNMLVSIDVRNQRVDCKRLWIKEENLQKLENSERNIEDVDVIKSESEDYRLNNYFNYIVLDKINNMIHNNVEYGKRIYKTF
jgi:hypothetical protein